MGAHAEDCVYHFCTLRTMQILRDGSLKIETPSIIQNGVVLLEREVCMYVCNDVRDLHKALNIHAASLYVGPIRKIKRLK